MKINSFIKSFLNNFNNYPDAVIVIDYNNNITQWNKQACELFGYTKQEMIGRNIAIIFDFEVDKIHEILKTGKHPVISAKNNFFKDIFIEISCKKIEKEKKVIITARDVTKNQKVIEKLLFEYEKAARISMYKNSFITGLSGELKSPTHSLVGFSQGLLDGICGELNEKQLKYVTIMNKNANALLNVITDFLELSRLEREDIVIDAKVFDVTKTITKIGNTFKDRATKKGLRFELDLDDLTRKNIYSNEEFLSKTIFNLTENAVKFTESGTVGIKVMHPDLDFVKTQGLKIFHNFTNKSYLLFKITDTGIGMTEENIAVIFDEYSQTARNTAKKYGGTGLKLALTKKMINRIGGNIWVESEFGQGSSFSFIVPTEKPVIIEPSEELEYSGIN